VFISDKPTADEGVGASGGNALELVAAAAPEVEVLIGASEEMASDAEAASEAGEVECASLRAVCAARMQQRHRSSGQVKSECDIERNDGGRHHARSTRRRQAAPGN
jgi:hypothetical protein